MNRDKAIEYLESLRDYCLYMYEEGERGTWKDDVMALKSAIKILVNLQVYDYEI